MSPGARRPGSAGNHAQGVEADTVDASEIHFELLRQTLQAQNYSLEWKFGEENLRVTLMV